MRPTSSYIAGLGTGAALAVTVPLVAQLELPNTFQPGAPASAEEVNANFEALAQTIDSLESQVGDLQARLQAVEDSEVAELNDYLEVAAQPPTDTGTQGPLVRFTGANVQVVNGTGEQGTANGVGNLIVGYDKPRLSLAPPVCSDGEYRNATDCENNGGVWSTNHKSGSHNLVGGDGNAYSQTGGIVFGSDNVANRLYASVIGGSSGEAQGRRSVVVGGVDGEALADSTVVVGGERNVAGGASAVVLGGEQNEAAGPSSVVLGGNGNVEEGIVQIAPSGDSF